MNPLKIGYWPIYRLLQKSRLESLLITGAGISGKADPVDGSIF